MLSVFVVTEVLSIASENVTMVLSVVIEILLWLSVGETEETVGAVVSTTKVFTFNVLLALLTESVTEMVQL